MKDEFAAVIAARCKAAGMNGIRESNIRSIKEVAARQGKDWFMREADYSFTHKGASYIVNQEIVGDKRYSALFKYTVKKIDGGKCNDERNDYHE